MDACGNNELRCHERDIGYGLIVRAGGLASGFAHTFTDVAVLPKPNLLHRSLAAV